MLRDLTGESERSSLSDSTEMGHGNSSPTKIPARGRKKPRAACAGVSPTPLWPWKGRGGHSHPREAMGMEGGTWCKDRGLGCAARVNLSTAALQGWQFPSRTSHCWLCTRDWDEPCWTQCPEPSSHPRMDGNGISEPGTPVTLPGLGAKRKKTPKGSEGHLMKHGFPHSWVLWLPRAVAAPCKMRTLGHCPAVGNGLPGERDMAWAGGGVPRWG